MANGHQLSDQCQIHTGWRAATVADDARMSPSTETFSNTASAGKLAATPITGETDLPPPDFVRQNGSWLNIAMQGLRREDRGLPQTGQRGIKGSVQCKHLIQSRYREDLTIGMLVWEHEFHHRSLPFGFLVEEDNTTDHCGTHSGQCQIDNDDAFGGKVVAEPFEERGHP